MKTIAKSVTYVMIFSVACLAATAGTCRTAGAADKQTGTLKQIPKGTAIAIRIRALAQTELKLAHLLDRAIPGTGLQLTRQLDAARKRLFADGKLKGLKPDGWITLALLKFPEANQTSQALPPFVLLAEVDDYKMLRDSIVNRPSGPKAQTKELDGYEQVKLPEGVFYLTKHQNCLAVTMTEQVAANLAKGECEFGVPGSEQLCNLLDTSDVGVYVDMAKVRARYGAQIESARTQIQAAFQAAAAMQQGAMDAEMMKASMEISKQFVETMFDFINDTTAVGVGVTLEQDGAVIRAAADVEPESETATRLAEFRPATAQLLGLLPAKQQMYFAVTDPVVYDVLQSLGFTGFQQTRVMSQKMKKAIEQQKAAKLQEVATTVTFTDKGMRSVSIATCEDPEKYIAASIEGMKLLEGGAMPFKFKSIKEKKAALQHRGIELDLMSADLEFPEAKNQFLAQMMAAQMKSMFGEKITLYTGMWNGKVLQFFGYDEADVKKELDNIIDGKVVSKAKETSSVCDKLPEKATMVVLVDFPSYFSAIMSRMMAAVAPQGVPGFAPPETASYIGVAVGLQPKLVTAQVWLSCEAVNNIVKTFSQMGPQGQLP